MNTAKNETRFEYYDVDGNLTENKEDAFEIYELDANAECGGVFAMAMGKSKLIASKHTGLNVEAF